MNISYLVLNTDLAGFVLTVAAQSIIISLSGIIVIKLVRKKSAPVRSLACTGVIAVLGLVLIVSAGFRISGASWSGTALNTAIDIPESDFHLQSSKISRSITETGLKPVSTANDIPIKNSRLPSSEIFRSDAKTALKPVSTREEYDIVPLSEALPGKSDNSEYSHSFLLAPAFISIINSLGIIWFTGMLFLMIRLGYGFFQVNKFRKSLKPVSDIFYKNMVGFTSRVFWKDRTPDLYRSPDIESPLAIGLFKPIIIIPEKLFDSLNENELKSILLHEFSHIYHHDQFMGVIKRIVTALHWWNPIVHMLNRTHEQAREEISDNYVLSYLHPEIYTRCLANLAEKVCLISNLPAASCMAGRNFDLCSRVENILSKKRRIAMNTKLYLKTVIFSVGLAFTFGVAGLHARVSAVKNDDTVRVLQEPLQAINSVSIPKEDQNLTQKNISEPEAVDEPEKMQSIPKPVTMPQKELSGRQAQKNEKPVMVMASVDMKAMNKIEKPMDSVSVQSSGKPVLLTQNKTAGKHDSKASDVPDKGVQNDKPDNAANDSKKEDIDTAIADLSRQIELNDSDAGLYLLRGNLHMDKQDYGQALNDYTKAIEINPDDAVAYNNRGQAYANMKEYKQAIKDYKKAIKRDPENKYVYINRGNAYYARRCYRRAISDYTRAIKIDPQFSLVYKNIGITYLQKRSFSKAIKDFSKALELNVRDAWTYLLRGNAYYSKREYRQAVNDYNKALEINPDLIYAYNNRGMAHEGMGELDKAIYDYSKVIEITSEDTDAYIHRKLIYTQKARINQAVKAYQIPLLTEKDFANGLYEDEYHLPILSKMTDRFSTLYEYSAPYINRGRLYIKTNQLDKAISDFSKAIEINPDSYAAYNYRSVIYSMMGNMVEFKNDKHMVMQLNPDLMTLEAEKEFEALLRTRPYQHQECTNCEHTGDPLWLFNDNRRRLGY